MDASRFKRREIQTRRPRLEPTPGLPDIVPGVGDARPRTIPAPTPAVLQQTVPTPVTSQQPLKVVVEIAESPLAARRMPPIDMNLPGGPSQFKITQPVDTDRQFAKFRRWSLRAAVVLIVLVVGSGGLLFSQGFIKLHRVFKGGAVTAAALTANVNPNLLKGEGDGRVNVLLLGRGGGNHDGPDLTDTMMLASIDPVNHTSTMLSIPRDLWVDVPNQGAMKINAAWETGEFKYLGKIAPGSTNSQAIQAGFDEVDQTVETVLGVPINYNILVDFQAFQQAVDSVNGVMVNVPTDLIDPTMAWENHNNPVLAKAGLQAFNGKQALIYVRSRETTSDFARSQRQRAVMMALKSKVETLGTVSNPIKIASLLNAFGDNVATDLSLTDATRMYSIIKDIGDNNVASIGLADGTNHYVTTGQMSGQSIDLPTAGLFSYSAIQTYVRTQLKDGYIVKENAKVLVLNGTPTSGIATTVANQLKTYGYNVIGAANAPTNGWAQTTLVDLSQGKAKYTAHYLEQRFNVTATTKLSDPAINANGADFVIIVGSDETSTPKI